jgi:polyphosphate kinase
VVRAHLAELFPGREVSEFSQFRVTRHSDLAVDEDDVVDLRMALRQGLHHRHYGQAVRLEVSSCSVVLSDLLLEQYGLPAEALFRVKGPVNLVRQMQLIDLVDDPALLFPSGSRPGPRSSCQAAPSWRRCARATSSSISPSRASMACWSCCARP